MKLLNNIISVVILVFDLVSSPNLLEFDSVSVDQKIEDKIYYFQSKDKIQLDSTINTINSANMKPITFTVNTPDDVNIQIPSFKRLLLVNIPIDKTKLFAISHKHTHRKIENIFYIYVDRSYHKVILTVSSFNNGFHKNNILKTQEFPVGNQTQSFNIFDNIVNAFFEVDKFLETYALLRSDKVYSFKKIIERLKPIAIFLLVIVFILLGLPMTLLKEEGTINYNKYFSLFLQKILLYIVIFEEFNGFNILIDGFFLMMKIFLSGTSGIFSSFSSLSSREFSLYDLFILSSSYDIMQKIHPFLNIALILNVSLAFVYMFISIYFLPVAFIISTIGYYDDLIKKVFEKIISCFIFIFLHNLTYIIMVFILNGVFFATDVFDDPTLIEMGQNSSTRTNLLLFFTNLLEFFDDPAFIEMGQTFSIRTNLLLFSINILGYIFHLVFQLVLHFFIISFYMTQCSSFIEKLSGFTGVNTMDHASNLMMQIPGYAEQLKSIVGIYVDKSRAQSERGKSDKEVSNEEIITRDRPDSNNDGSENNNTEIKIKGS